MPTYMTRHLVAVTEVRQGDRLIPPGESFEATHVDAEYLIGHKKAREGEVPRREPIRAAVAAPVVEAAAPAHAFMPDPPADVVPEKRKPGRPPKVRDGDAPAVGHEVTPVMGTDAGVVAGLPEPVKAPDAKSDADAKPEGTSLE